MTEHISRDDLADLLTKIFLRHRCTETTARMLAENMATAEGDGALSHGIFRITGNLASLDSGWVDGMAVPTVEDVAPGMVRADGNNGFALPAFAATPAGVSRRLILMDGLYLLGFGPRTASAVRDLAAQLYPEMKIPPLAAVQTP